MSDIVGHASAERYWEGRWRDEAKRVTELEAEKAQHLEEISRLQADIIQMRGWVATPDGMRDARVAELEGALRTLLADAEEGNKFGRAIDLLPRETVARARAVLNAPANADCPECHGTKMTRWLGRNNDEEVGPCSTCATPRPAQSPAGAVRDDMLETISHQ